MDSYVPIKAERGALPRKGTIDASLPKYFKKPMTCFFWHQNGWCRKRDEECPYAHWNTGHLASSPIRPSGGGGSVSVAGKESRTLTGSAVQPQNTSSNSGLMCRERALQLWENELELREHRLAEREAAVEKREAGLHSRSRRVARRVRPRGSTNTVTPMHDCKESGSD